MTDKLDNDNQSKQGEQQLLRSHQESDSKQLDHEIEQMDPEINLKESFGAPLQSQASICSTPTGAQNNIGGNTPGSEDRLSNNMAAPSALDLQADKDKDLIQQFQTSGSQSKQPASSSLSGQAASSSSTSGQKVPDIPRVTNLQPGSKGRNFESYSGLMEITPGSSFYKKKSEQEFEGDQESQRQAEQREEELKKGEGAPTQQMKVQVKLYKKQQAKIDEAQNQQQVFDVVDHPNVIKCLDTGMVEFRGNMYTYFVFPAYQADLFVVLSKTGRLPEPIARYYLKQLVDGLQAIQDKGFAHRNLKPKNLYIDAQDNFNLKIADFVFASHLNENSKTFVGTIDYMSPEIHLKLPHEPGKADVFAVGVILFNMITGQAPFQKATREDKNYPTLIEDTTAFWKQVSGTLHPEISSLTPHFKSLIEFCLRLEPIERPFVGQFKFAAWTRGHTATKDEVLEEMTNRFRVLKLIPQPQPQSQQPQTANSNNSMNQSQQQQAQPLSSRAENNASPGSVMDL